MTTTMTISAAATAAMAESARVGRMELPRDGTLRLSAGTHGVRIRAERGTVLVTREGDVTDHVLERGDELLVTGAGLVVAWALAPSALVLTRESARPAREPAGSRAA